MKTLCLFLIFSIALASNCLAIGSWSQAGMYDGGSVDMPFSFTIGTKGYVGGGRTSLNTFNSDFWEYEASTNTWTQLAAYPGGDKGGQVSFVISGKAYVGLGFDLTYYKDFYEYDPATNVWTQLGNFPGNARYSASWFTIGNNGYVVGGWNGSALSDCWEYTASTDTWVQKASFPAGNRQAAVGFAISGMGYVCTGFNQPNHFNDLWQFDPVGDVWTAKAPFPGTARRGCAAFVLNDEAYVGLGYDGAFMPDFYRYNPVTDTWNQDADFGGTARYIPFNFTINNTVYMGAGSNGTVQAPTFNNDFWVFETLGDQNLIQGKKYVDFNSNNIQDTLEPSLINSKIIETNTGNIAFTNQNGFYSLAVPDTGNYQVMPNDSLNNFAPNPTDYPVYFNAVQQIDSLNDFAFQAAGIFNDLCVTISPTGLFRSGFNASYMINYTNAGNTVQNATVVFYPDTSLVYDSSTPMATTITPDSVVFAIGNLNPFQSGQILVTVTINLGVPIGTLINSSAMILPVIGDVNPSCNLAFWEILTTGSFDPNDILVNRSFLYDYEVPSQPELEYLIRFQNTGNDTAFTVRVMNTIDTTNLHINTFEFVASSHAASITWLPSEGSMKFLFENILLPDSFVNEPMSHGFIRYKIKPKANLLVGDTITSQAFIFFDFNSAVETNIAQTAIIIPTSINEQPESSEMIHVYPNPANNLITVSIINSNKYQSISLCNIYGHVIQTISIDQNSKAVWTKTIDTSKLAAGVYFIKLNGQTSTLKKFLKY